MHWTGAQIAINLANASEFHARLSTVLRPGFRVIIINAWKAQLSGIYVPRGNRSRVDDPFTFVLLSFARFVTIAIAIIADRAQAWYRVDSIRCTITWERRFQGENAACKVAGSKRSRLRFVLGSLEEMLVKAEGIFLSPPRSPTVQCEITMSLHCGDVN